MTIWTLAKHATRDFARTFETMIAPHLAASGGAPIAACETEHSANNFPRLPVREGEHAFAWFARLADVTDPRARSTAAIMVERATSVPPDI